MKKITMYLQVFLVFLAIGCERNTSCGRFYVTVNFYEMSAMQAKLELPPFLYVTTTDLRSSTSVLDRVLLDEGMGDTWELDERDDIVAAPFILRCDEPRLNWYPFHIQFNLADVAQNPVDETLFPSLDFDFPAEPKNFEVALWNDFQLGGYLDGAGEPNTPVDTGTW